MALAIGCTNDQVRYIAARHGLTWRADSHLCEPKVDPGVIFASFQETGSIQRSANELGLSRNTVRKYLIKAGEWPQSDR